MFFDLNNINCKLVFILPLTTTHHFTPMRLRHDFDVKYTIPNENIISTTNEVYDKSN